MKKFLLVCLLVCAGCGLLAPNKTETVTEELAAVAKSETEKPGAPVASAAEGDVYQAIGDKAIDAMKAKAKKGMTVDASYDAMSSIKNPFTWILTACGILATFLVCAYVFRRLTGRKLDDFAQKVFDPVMKTIEDALTDAKNPSEKELIRKIESSVNRVRP